MRVFSRSTAPVLFCVGRCREKITTHMAAELSSKRTRRGHLGNTRWEYQLYDVQRTDDVDMPETRCWLTLFIYPTPPLQSSASLCTYRRVR